MQTPNKAELLAAARDARGRAYAPYSKFSVGAALLTASGETITGANVENASFGLSMCAERIALFSAVVAGHRSFAVLALVGPDGVAITPCGACRQALAEFGSEIRIVREGLSDVTLRELLPEPFEGDAVGRTRV